MKPHGIPRSWKAVSAAGVLLAFSAVYPFALAQQRASEEAPLLTQHADCVFFGPRQHEFKRNSLDARASRRYEASRLTTNVASQLPAVTAKPAARAAETTSGNVVDEYLNAAWEAAGVTPAAPADDFVFARRVTLDLAGRVPTPDLILSFAAETSPAKRQKLVDQLLASPYWVDKWTMFFGDLLKNTVRTAQVVRFAEGRDAFHAWIRQSLANNKPYDRMATELITASGQNSYEQGELNWLVGGFVTGGPRTGQDLFDQMAVNTVTTFLGIAHFNCVMCHNGRGRLDTLSLWGKNAARVSAYQMASFFSHTALARRPIGQNGFPYYWSVLDNTTFRTDYQLNTTTGNRPPRSPIGAVSSISPVYMFSGNAPQSGENYRVALARELTADFQFARAAVNYIWREFMGKGFVEPPDQFDPARLDPDNPPEEPWTLQPNQPRLLNALAQQFIGSGFDLKALMRTIVTSRAYQLESRYEGEWDPAWEDLYARKLVRRLWAEEIHDAVVQTSNVPVTYRLRPSGEYQWAMQLPDVVAVPGGNASSFLDSFFRGNRDDEDRRMEGSTLQALNLMNDTFVLSRTRAGAANSTSLVRKALAGDDQQLVNTLFLSILSRYPNSAENDAALASLKDGSRQQRAEDLAWSLYNKVDFIFNY